MSFGVLGPLEIVVDGRTVSVGPGHQRSLLVTLLLHANKVVGFDELVEAGWGERGPVHPRAAVHTCVTRLRKVLGGVGIEGSADGYRIVVDEQAVDVYRICARARRQRRGRDGQLSPGTRDGHTAWSRPGGGRGVDRHGVRRTPAGRCGSRRVGPPSWVAIAGEEGSSDTDAQVGSRLSRWSRR
jgi:hypothetical protein